MPSKQELFGPQPRGVVTRKTPCCTVSTEYTLRLRLLNRILAWAAPLFAPIFVVAFLPGKWPRIICMAVLAAVILPFALVFGATIGSLIELTYSALENKMKSVWWALVVVFAAIPPVMLYVEQTNYTPMISVIFSGILAVFAALAGNQQAVDKAKREANDRWLPQAKSACNRLLTVWCSIKSLRAQLASSCGSIADKCPSLKEAENSAAKMFIENQCTNSAGDLEGIAHHLEDAYSDWHSFIAANCSGNECEQIFQALEERKKQLEATVPKCDAKPVGAPVARPHRSASRQGAN